MVRKHIAVTCLVAAFLLFIFSVYYEDIYPWLGFTKAFSEAALIGGLADWFAVVALFRHPLGIKLPHTAIIPNNQERIAESLGDFIKKNFLSEEVLAERLSDAKLIEYDIPGKVVRWLDNPENLSRVLDELLFSIRESVIFMNEGELKRFFSENASGFIRNYSFSPLLGRVLAIVVEEERHMDFFDRSLVWFGKVLDSITPESSWWHVVEKLKLFAMRRELKSVSADPEHVFRKIFDERVRALAVDLAESSEYTISFEKRFKEELLGKPEVFQSIDRLWIRLKSWILEDVDRPDSHIRDQAGRFIKEISTNLLTNGNVKYRVNKQIQKFFLHLANNYSNSIGGFISSQVKSWDTEKLTRELEHQVGNDLQYIRLNGTIIGGLIGLVIYSVIVFVRQ